MSSVIALPRLLRIGGGCSADLADVLSDAELSRPLIITDPYLAAQPFLDRIVSRLDAAGVRAEVFSEVRPDPTTDSVDKAVQVFHGGEFDCVVGIGGGSPMDTAKAVALLGSRGGSMGDYKAPILTDTPTLPLIAIPTTAGSGSECTRFTIITDSATNEKMLCAGLAFLPTIALVDYELTMRMPARLTADTGVDALVHAVEAFVSRKSNPFTDDLALTAMRTLFTNLRIVYEDPSNASARAQMMLASTQAGIAFSNSSVALVHGMSRPLGAHFNVAHGLSNSMLMPDITAFSVDAAPARYATCARTLGIATDDLSDAEAAARLVTGLHDLNTDLEVPGPRQYGISQSSWREKVAIMARQAKASGSPDNNPRIASVPEIEELYESLWR